MKPLTVLAAFFLAVSVACGSSSSSSAEPPPGTPPQEDAGSDTTDGGTADGAPLQPRSCDPFTPRRPPPELLIGPDGLEKRVLDEIASARKSLRVFIYELDRDSVVNALVAAHERGVRVEVIVDKSKSTSAKSILRNAGATVKDSAPEFTYQHAKTILVDDERVLILSGNLNDYTFESERNYGVVDRDPSDVADVRAVFERDLAGEGAVDVGCTKLVVAPENARERLEGLVKGAKKSLDLEVMYVTDRAMVAAIKEKHAAGVPVRVLLADPRWIQSNTATASDLAAAGISVRYYKELELHAKMIVADGAAFVGSENLSYNSLENNREIGVLVTEPDVVAGIRAQVEADWAAGVAP